MLRAGSKERPPIGAALFEYVCQILLPGAAVLLLILDDRALDSRREIMRRNLPGAEARRKRHAVGKYRDSLGRREDAGGSFEFVLSVQRLACPEFAEYRHDLFNRLICGHVRAKFKACCELADPAA